MKVVMKRILCFIIIICALISATGCGYATQRKRNQYLNLYEKEENFVSLTGKVTEVDNGENAQILKIECPDLLNYVSQKEYERIQYRVYSDLPLDLEVGETITFITVPAECEYSYTLSIVSVDKDGENILDFEKGKASLIAWANQLQYK